MAVLFELVSKTDHGLEQMQEIFGRHVVKTGVDSLAACAVDAATDAGLYVTEILRVYKKYRQCILLVFSNHCLFSTALDRACQKFVNCNAVTNASPKYVMFVVNYAICFRCFMMVLVLFHFAIF